jgi:hypothetical protein
MREGAAWAAVNEAQQQEEHGQLQVEVKRGGGTRQRPTVKHDRGGAAMVALAGAERRPRLLATRGGVRGAGSSSSG